VKRRKFATAVAFLAALLAVAIAASTVGAATSRTPVKKVLKGAHGKAPFKKNHAAFAGSASFVNSGAKNPLKPVRSAETAKKFQKSSRVVNRGIPGKVLKKGGASGAAAASAAAAAGIPVAHSLQITTQNYQPAARGLGSFEQWVYGGYALTPPDQALAEGNGFVVEAVNNLWQVSGTNFGHVSNVESTEAFFAPAIIDSGYNCLSDPKANYDNRTRKWFMTEVAYGFCGGGSGLPGSAVFIAVSTTSDPLGPYNLYVLDTSFDGALDNNGNPFGLCGFDGCLADQPLLGMDEHALFISTNSFDWDSCILVGPDCVFNGAQMYAIDSTALAAGFAFPNVYYLNIGALDTPDASSGCGLPFFTFYPFSAFCWYSVQPATSPNRSQNELHGGTEFALAAQDWFGSIDNAIGVWAFTNTVAISSVIPSFIEWSWVDLDVQNYGFPATDTPFFAPWAEQPPSGHTTACDVFYGPFCTPTAIETNDDRMNEVKSVATSQTTYIWGGLNTKVLVSDPIHKQHRRAGIAWFSVRPTAWDGFDLVGAGVVGQGYVANWNNDVLFPAIGVDTTGQKGAMVYSLTGNTNYPSVAVSKVKIGTAVNNIQVVSALAGKDLLDDLSGYFGFAARYGDYSAAVADGHTIYLASEYVPFVNCEADEYINSVFFGSDPVFPGTCGGIRNPLTNYGTGLVRIGV